MIRVPIFMVVAILLSVTVLNQPASGQCQPISTIVYKEASGTDTQMSTMLNSYSGKGVDAPPALLTGTDLSGNLEWSFCEPATLTRQVNATAVLTILQQNKIYYVEEIDLTNNNVLSSFSSSKVNADLSGFQILDFNHEAIPLPNGFTATIGHVEELVDCSQYPAQCPTAGQTQVDILGDAIIVANPADQANPVTWSWNAFDFLNLNRPATLGETCTPSGAAQGGGCPIKLAPVANDWLHANSLYYDPSDGNLVINIRNQDWFVKVCYTNGTGDGHVIWTAGYQGNFTLLPDQHGVTPTWFSHEHDVTSTGGGVYTLLNNANVEEATNRATTSSGIVLQLDEEAFTIQYLHDFNLGSYSPGSGTAQVLDNGNYWFLLGRPELDGELFSRGIEISPQGQFVYIETSVASRYRAIRSATY